MRANDTFTIRKTSEGKYMVLCGVRKTTHETTIYYETADKVRELFSAIAGTAVKIVDETGEFNTYVR